MSAASSPRCIWVLLCMALASTAHAARDDAGAFRIVATDAGFEGPARVPAGLRHVLFENHGHEIHEAMFVKLADGMSAGDYARAVAAGELFPKGALDYSGPALLDPRGRAEVWTRLDPGDYVIICWNHARGHRLHSLSVTAAGARDDPAPKEDVVVRLRDFRFEQSNTPRKGWQIVRFDTLGPSLHEADLFRLHPGKATADLLEWRRLDGAGAAPADALGGILDSHDIRRVSWMRLRFTPGRYVWHCEMPLDTDAKAGSAHATHADAGMYLEFSIDG